MTAAFLLSLALSAAPAGDAKLKNAFAAAEAKRTKAMWDIYNGDGDATEPTRGTPWTRPEPKVVKTPTRKPRAMRSVHRAGFEPGTRVTVRSLVGGRATVTSRFGVRASPISMGISKHRGVDVAAPEGTAIYAAAAGTVIHAGWRGGYGRVVEIDHGSGLTTRYAHTWKLHVREGQRVLGGQLIAGVGMTGRATGPHLHFEVRASGKAINPHWALRRYGVFKNR